MIRFFIFHIFACDGVSSTNCSLFNVDCQTAGALINLVRVKKSRETKIKMSFKNEECFNSSNSEINANLTNLYLSSNNQNGSVLNDCALDSAQLLNYSSCFDNFTTTFAGKNCYFEIILKN